MDVWTKHPHPVAGGGKSSWEDAIGAWLHDWALADAEAEGWTTGDGPLVWPEYLEELEDHDLNLAVLPTAELELFKGLFLEVYARALEPRP